MDSAKLRLSTKEAELVGNADWILTKNEILRKVHFMLGDLQQRQQQLISEKSSLLPSEVTSVHGKISRGENYKGLPWLVLDYPRYFVKEDHFAIRTMFWWGNFFSITLHLAGHYEKMYEKKIGEAFNLLNRESYFIGVNTDKWEHHFEPDNYVPLTTFSEQAFLGSLRDREFIKLAKKIALDEWDEAVDKLYRSFSDLVGLLL